MTIYVVFSHRYGDCDAPAAFTKQSDAASYLQRQQNLERQRHGLHAAVRWTMVPVESTRSHD